MRALTAAEGIDQIEALTSGVDIPAPELPLAMLTLVAEFIEEGWEKVTKSRGASASNGDEPQVTGFLESELKHLRREPGWKNIIRNVGRGSQHHNFNGRLMEKQPDLVLSLTDDAYFFPVIVECKIVHPATGRTLSDYCTDGIDRFVSGDYGWGSAEGIMLAYARDGSTPAKHLANYLAANPHSTTAPLKRLMRAIGAGETHHHRTFRYPTRRPPDDDPKSIKLWHLWL